MVVLKLHQSNNYIIYVPYNYKNNFFLHKNLRVDFFSSNKSQDICLFYICDGR